MAPSAASRLSRRSSPLSGAKLPLTNVRGTWGYGISIIEKLTKEQKRVDFGIADAFLTGRGSVENPTDSLSGRKGLIGLTLQVARDLQDDYRNVKVVNETKTVALWLFVIVEDGHSEQNRLYTANANVVINTNHGRITAENEDEGVWLLDKSGEKVATASVVSSQSGYSVVKFAMLPEAGEYTLVYVCRDGEDASEYTPAVKTIKVVVGE